MPFRSVAGQVGALTGAIVAIGVLALVGAPLAAPIIVAAGVLGHLPGLKTSLFASLRRQVHYLNPLGLANLP